MAYDERYRKRAVEHRPEGNTIEKTAKTFKIGETTLKEWVRRYKESGEIKNKPLNRTHKKIDPKELELFVEEHPDAYLVEIAEAFNCCVDYSKKQPKFTSLTIQKQTMVFLAYTEKLTIPCREWSVFHLECVVGISVDNSRSAIKCGCAGFLLSRKGLQVGITMIYSPLCELTNFLNTEGAAKWHRKRKIKQQAKPRD